MSSYLDYCNSLLSGIAQTDLPQLQRILNHLACVVTKSPPFTHSVPLLRSPHWLPVKYSPFQDLLADVQVSSWGTTCLPLLLDCLFSSIIILRSNTGITLSVPRTRTNTGARAFSSCGPSLWSNLPLSVHSATFRRSLKRTFSTWPFLPRRHWCAQWPVDVTE